MSEMVRDYEVVVAEVWDILHGMFVKDGVLRDRAHAVLEEASEHGVPEEAVSFVRDKLKERRSTGHYRGGLRKRWIRMAIAEVYEAIMDRYSS